jgi:Ca-activated chloride channel homolog
MRSAAFSSAGCFWSRPVGLAVILITISVALASAQSGTAPAPNSPNGAQASQPPTSVGSDASKNNSSAQEPSAAQEPSTSQPANDQSDMFVFRKQVEEVVLHATVVDEQGRLITGLDRSAFTVFEHGVPQTITSFRREDIPVAMGIVVDNSGSMRDKREKVNQAVLNLIRASNPKDEIFVVNFNENPYLDQDFTSDENLLRAALHQVSMKGSTALYDAVTASSLHLNNAKLDKKVLLVITDGQDNMSRETLQEASRKLEQVNGPTLYSIGLLGLRGQGREALRALSRDTGGVAYFPDTLDEVDNITRTIAHDIRSQYMIAYKPQNQNERPGYQDLRLEAHAPGYGKLTVRTKTGYYAGDSAH